LPSCLLLIAESRKYHPVVVLLHNDIWLKTISTKFNEVGWNSAVYFIFDIVSFDISSNCRHFNCSPLLCPINATSSSSYVFRLQYPRVLHCRIVPIEKMKTLVGFWWQNPPGNHLGKAFESHAQSSRKLLVDTWQGGEYLHETFVRHHSDLKYIVFLWIMIKLPKYLLFLS
jgi:hypothetical protein